MNYYIEVFHQSKRLFQTDENSCPTMDALVSVYAVLQKQFPEEQGFFLRATAYWKDTLDLGPKEFGEAVKQGKGKGFIMRLKYKQQRAHYMAFVLLEEIKKKLI